MQKNKDAYCFYSSIVMVIGISIMSSLGWLLYILLYCINPSEEESVIVHIVFFVFLVLGPMLMIFIAITRWGIKITISREGISSSILGFNKKKILWNEIEEIKVFVLIGGWIFFSKNNLDDLPYNEIIKRKDTIQLEYSKKKIDIIRKFTDKEIKGLPN